MGEPGTQPGSDDTATVAEPAASRRISTDRPSGRLSDLPSGDSSSSRVTSVVTARETLHLQEIARTRTFAWVVIAFSALVAGTLLVVGGDPVAKRVFIFALAAIAASCAWLGWEIRTDAGYTIAKATAVAYVCVFGAFSGIWFFGVFSPAPMILPFGLSFFSIGQSTRAVLAVYLTCALTQLALMGLVIAGALPDEGMVHATGLTRPEQLMIVLLVQATLLVTYLIQRKTRQATIHAIEMHDHVVRSLAQRDALLREARQELAQAMQPGGMGRWTGEVVGSFRLGQVIGRGAMGEVYEATRVGSDEPAAVKLLHPHVLAQPELVQRFVREAKIVGALSVANVVHVLEVSAPEEPVPYIAMERLVGHDLAEYLREHKRMGIRGVLTMLRQVGLGLDAAREAGVVHRDLKPRNLFLARRGGSEGAGASEVWKILDFGVARQSGEETLTRDQIVGTPNYMAPEQANGAAVTHRTDLFALGVIAYRALTGQPAFEGETTAEILYKVVHTMPQRPSEVAPLPPQVDLVLAVALAKDPVDRFASAAELAQAVDGAARGRIEPGLAARAERLLSRLPWGAAR